MSGNNKDPADVVQQFIEKNKNALSEISFGGGTITILNEWGYVLPIVWSGLVWSNKTFSVPWNSFVSLYLIHVVL